MLLSLWFDFIRIANFIGYSVVCLHFVFYQCATYGFFRILAWELGKWNYWIKYCDGCALHALCEQRIERITRTHTRISLCGSLMCWMEMWYFHQLLKIAIKLSNLIYTHYLFLFFGSCGVRFMRNHVLNMHAVNRWKTWDWITSICILCIFPSALCTIATKKHGRKIRMAHKRQSAYWFDNINCDFSESVKVFLKRLKRQIFIKRERCCCYTRAVYTLHTAKKTDRENEFNIRNAKMRFFSSHIRFCVCLLNWHIFGLINLFCIVK